MESSAGSFPLSKYPAAQQAHDFYADWPENPFFKYVGIHQFTGYVFNQPDFFIMGRPVDRNAPRCEITNPEHVFNPKHVDTWFIWLYGGDLTKAFTIIPYWLPYCAYERRDDFHIATTEKTMKLLQKMSSHGKPSNTISA